MARSPRRPARGLTCHPPIPPGIEGIVRIRELPDDEWCDRWDRIFVADGIKDRLLNALVFDLRQRRLGTAVGLATTG